MVCRILLGFAEAGLFPGLTFLISTIYTREAQAKRVAVIYAAGAASGAFGGLIAYGIQLMGDQRGLEAWRWLFIVEGCISVAIVILIWFIMPKTPETAWFLTTAEKETMVKKQQRDFLYKGDDKWSWKYAAMAFKDWHIYLAALCSFCSSIPLFGFVNFLPTIIRAMGSVSLFQCKSKINLHATGTPHIKQTTSPSPSTHGPQPSHSSPHGPQTATAAVPSSP
jgi:MFS family permease